MAAKRIAASAIDWVKFAELVPETQKPFYLAFKGKADNYLRKAMSQPENPPKINWAQYRSQIVIPGIVDNFEKEYTAFKVPYPKENVSGQIDAQAKQVEQNIQKFCQESQVRISKYTAELEKMNNMIPIEHMTMDDLKDTFPDQAFDPINRPTFWPHNDEDFPEDYDDDNETSKSHH